MSACPSLLRYISLEGSVKARLYCGGVTTHEPTCRGLVRPTVQVHSDLSKFSLIALETKLSLNISTSIISWALPGKQKLLPPWVECAMSASNSLSLAHKATSLNWWNWPRVFLCPYRTQARNNFSDTILNLSLTVGCLRCTSVHDSVQKLTR